jgi:micrococcal nuclease
MRWASLLLGFLVGLVAAQTLKFPAPQGQTLKATVVSVTDGDTIKVRVGNELQTVRLIGYDSPEPNQNFSDKASLYLKTLLEGLEVILERDVQATDKYGRRLYHVWLPQVLVGELMLLSGLGQIMTIPPNVRHSDYYQRVQTAARSVGLGIWAVPFPTGRATQERTTQGRATQEGSDIVYITRTGTKFHRAGCRYLRYSAIPIKRSEAIAQGYSPCSVCRP